MALIVGNMSCAAIFDGSATPSHDYSASSMIERLRRDLTLPPSHQTLAAVQQLEQMRDSCAARWARARYLLDLLDLGYAFSGERDEVGPEQRSIGKLCVSLLRQVLRVSEANVGRRTDIEALRAELASMPSTCVHGHRLAAQATLLLDTDGARRDRPEDALTASLAYKRVLRSGSQLATNAQLRLVDWCTRVFRRAAREAPSRQQVQLNYCLYPLFDADPAPYFAADPAQRPPDPPWTVLRVALEQRREQLIPTRFAVVARMQRRFDERYFVRIGALLPAALDLRRIGLPVSRQGQILDRFPIVHMTERGFSVDRLAVPPGDLDALRQALARRLRGDSRGVLTLVSRPETSLFPLFDLGRAARKQGVTTLHLGVLRQVETRAPPGDIQATIAARGIIERLEGIPLSLRLLTQNGRDDVLRSSPRRLAYDPRAAPARLALTVQPAGLELSSRDGVLPVIPAAQLHTMLRLLQGAYPDERSLIIAPARQTSYAELVRIAQTARIDRRRPLFPAIALASPSTVAPPRRDITPLLYTLAHSQVRATAGDAASPPRALMDRIGRCYREAQRLAFARGKPPIRGTMRVTYRRGYRPQVTATFSRSRALRRCVADQLAAWPDRLPSGRTTLHFTDRGAPSS